MPLSRDLENFLMRQEILHTNIFNAVIITKEDSEILSSIAPWGFKWRHVYQAIKKHNPEFLCIEGAAPRAFFDMLKESSVKQLIMKEYPEAHRLPHFYDFIQNATSLEMLGIRTIKKISCEEKLVEAFEQSSLKMVEFYYGSNYYENSDKIGYIPFDGEIAERFKKLLPYINRKKYFSEQGIAFDNYVNALIEKLNNLETASKQEIQSAMILELFSHFYTEFNTNFLRVKNEQYSYADWLSKLSPYKDYILALMSFIRKILNKPSWKFEFHLSRSSSREAFEIQEKEGEFGDLTTFPTIENLLLTSDVTCEDAIENSTLMWISNEIKRQHIMFLYNMNVELNSRTLKERTHHYDAYTGTWTKFLYGRLSFDYLSLLNLKKVESSKLPSASVQISKETPPFETDLIVSEQDSREYQEAIRQYQHRTPISTHDLEKELQNLREAMEENYRLENIILSPEDKALLMKKLESQREEEERLSECLVIRKYPIYKKYYDAFKTYFSSLMLNALLLNSGRLDMNVGNVAILFGVASSGVTALLPRFRAASRPLTLMVQAFENKIRQKPLDHARTLNLTIEAADTLGEEIARLLVRAYHNTHDLACKPASSPKDLVVAQCERILDTLAEHNFELPPGDIAEYLARIVWDLKYPFNLEPLSTIGASFLSYNPEAIRRRQAHELREGADRLMQRIVPHQLMATTQERQLVHDDETIAERVLNRIDEHLVPELETISEKVSRHLPREKYDLCDSAELLKASILAGVNDYKSRQYSISKKRHLDCYRLEVLADSDFSKQVADLIVHFNPDSSDSSMDDNSLDACLIRALSENLKDVVVLGEDERFRTLTQAESQRIKKPLFIEFFSSTDKNRTERAKWLKRLEQWEILMTQFVPVKKIT